MANIYPRDYLTNKKFVYLGDQKEYYNKICFLSFRPPNQYCIGVYDPVKELKGILTDAPEIKKDDFIRCELFNEEKYPEYFI